MSLVEEDVIDEFGGRVLEALDGRVERLVLFGSYARGEELPGSDIDILIVLDERVEGDQSKVLGIASDYFWSDDVFFSPKLISKEDFEEKKDFSFFQDLQDEGVKIYG